jgi:DNA-binding MarR family transcriptional regulator
MFGIQGTKFHVLNPRPKKRQRESPHLFNGSSGKKQRASCEALNSPPAVSDMSYLEGAIGYAIHRARLSVMEDIYRAFSDYHITPTEFLILVIVSDNPGVSQADLAVALDVERPRMVPTLNKLERRGLATRTVCAGDGRVRRILLTKQGHHLVQVLKKRFVEHQKRILARLNSEESRTIFSSLWKLAGRVQGTRY